MGATELGEGRLCARAGRSGEGGTEEGHLGTQSRWVSCLILDSGRKKKTTLIFYLKQVMFT